MSAIFPRRLGARATGSTLLPRLLIVWRVVEAIGVLLSGRIVLLHVGGRETLPGSAWIFFAVFFRNIALGVVSLRSYFAGVKPAAELSAITRVATFFLLGTGLGIALHPSSQEEDFRRLLNQWTNGLYMLLVVPSMLSLYSDNLEDSAAGYVNLAEVGVGYGCHVIAAFRLVSRAREGVHTEFVIQQEVIVALNLFFLCGLKWALAEALLQLQREADGHKQAAEQIREEQGQRARERYAMTRLLSSLCDSRCIISNAADIIDPSPQLHDLLGMTGCFKTLFGTSLSGYLTQRDNERLRESLAPFIGCGAADSSGPAAMLSVEMIGADGSKIPVDLYHAQLSDSEHAVAITRREAAEGSSSLPLWSGDPNVVADSSSGASSSAPGVSLGEEAAGNDGMQHDNCDVENPASPGDEPTRPTQRFVPALATLREGDLSDPSRSVGSVEASGLHAEPVQADDDAASACPSVASTTVSNLVFLPGGDPSSLAQSLRNIASTGRREHWLLSNSDLELLPLKKLGRGGQSFVIGGLLNGAAVAVKICKILPERSKLQNICNELRVLRQIRHPNIAILYGACLSIQPADVAIVMEFVQGVTLDKLCGKDGSQSKSLFVAPTVGDTDRQGFIQEVCSALAYLHALQPACVHGDVKPSNVMAEKLANRYRTKLIDFGLARLLTTNTRPMGGTWHWTAPEVLLGFDKPQTTTDVFSFGRFVFFVASGAQPLGKASFQATMSEMSSHSRLPDMEWPARCQLAKTYRDLVSSCCRWVSIARPSMREVADTLLHPSERNSACQPQSSQERPFHQKLQEARELQDVARSERHDELPDMGNHSVSSCFRG